MGLTMHDTNDLKIYFDWDLTDWCDFECSYCYVKESLQKDFKSDWYIKNHKDVLFRLKTVETPFEICLTGGEPLLHPDILNILTSINQCKNSENIILFSNLSRPLPIYKKINDLNIDKLELLASYHVEFSDDNFIYKSKILSQSEHLKYKVQVMLHPDKKYWNKILDLIRQLISNNIEFRPVLLSSTHIFDVNYNNEFYETFKDVLIKSKTYDNIKINKEVIRGYDLIINKRNNFKGIKCRTTSFRISKDGTIENTCTNRKIPFLLINKNLVKFELCPRDKCDSPRLLEFYKEI